MNNPTIKQVLEAALKALLAASDAHWLMRIPATFVAELSTRIKKLPADQHSELALATPEALREAILELGVIREIRAHTPEVRERIEPLVQLLLRATEADRPILTKDDDNPEKTIARTILSLIWEYPRGGGEQSSWAIKESRVLHGDLEGARRRPGLGTAIFSTQLARDYFGKRSAGRVLGCVTWAVKHAQENPPYLLLAEDFDGIRGQYEQRPDFRHSLAFGVILARSGHEPDYRKHYLQLVLDKQRDDGGWPAGWGETISELFSAMYAVEFLDLCAKLPDVPPSERKAAERARDEGTGWLNRELGPERLWKCGLFKDELFDRIFATWCVIRRLAPCADHGNERWTTSLGEAVGCLIDVADAEVERGMPGTSDIQRFRLEARVASAASVALRSLPLDDIKKRNVRSYLATWRTRAHDSLSQSWMPLREMDLATALFLVDSLIEPDRLVGYAQAVVNEVGD